MLLAIPPAPVLCFINGCETAETAQGKDRLNVYGLAQAFLETGAYLLGTRWKVSDSAAAAFAPTFYDRIIKVQPRFLAQELGEEEVTA